MWAHEFFALINREDEALKREEKEMKNAQKRGGRRSNGGGDLTDIPEDQETLDMFAKWQNKGG